MKKFLLSVTFFILIINNSYASNYITMAQNYVFNGDTIEHIITHYKYITDYKWTISPANKNTVILAFVFKRGTYNNFINGKSHMLAVSIAFRCDSHSCILFTGALVTLNIFTRKFSSQTLNVTQITSLLNILHYNLTLDQFYNLKQ